MIETEQEAREIANKREQLQREQGLRTQKMLTLDEVEHAITFKVALMVKKYLDSKTSKF